MHMADALLSPAIGGVAWGISGIAVAIAAKRLRQEFDDSRVPLMGVLGAFIFAAQMINFTIPGTGSSGHLAGGMLLAILLGPEASLIAIASVLGVQSLFFADGGLLALGCNILNLGIIPAFFIYPLLFRPLAGARTSGKRFIFATVVSAIVALQLGSLAVVLETTLSGIAELPFATFAPLMAAIHLPIGLIEGVITALVVGWMVRVKPDIAISSYGAPKTHLAILALLTILISGLLSWYASNNPDGLEWSIAKVTGEPELSSPTSSTHRKLGSLQEQIAPMPDYKLGQSRESDRIGVKDSADNSATSDTESVADNGHRKSTSLAGLIGSLLVVSVVSLFGYVVRRLKRKKRGQ